MVSVLEGRIEALYREIAKLDEICGATPDNLLENKTSDAAKYSDKVMSVNFRLGLELQKGRASEAPNPASSQISRSMKAKLPQVELEEVEGNCRNRQHF